MNKNRVLLDELAERAALESHGIGSKSSAYRTTPGAFIERLSPEKREQLAALKSEDADARDIRDEVIGWMIPEVSVSERIKRKW